jgi:hypothetical protein
MSWKPSTRASSRRRFWLEIPTLKMRIQSDSGQEGVVAFSVIFIGFLGLGASWGFENKALNFVICIPGVLWMLMIYVSYLAKRAYFEVDSSQDRIISRRINLLGSEQIKSYKLSDYCAVISFLNSRNPTNRLPTFNCVELLEKNGGKGLLLAAFEPTRLNNKFLSIPKFGESQKAEALRAFFATSCRMTDLGFAGLRHPRSQSETS